MWKTVKKYAEDNGITVKGVYWRIKKGLIPADRIRKNDSGRIQIKERED